MPYTVKFGAIGALRSTPEYPGVVAKLVQAKPSAVSSLAISRFLRHLVHDLKDYEDSLLKLLKKHGTEKESTNTGTVYNVPVENLAAYNEEVTKLNDTDTEIAGKKLPWEAIEEIPDLTVGEISLLEPFIDVPTEE